MPEKTIPDTGIFYEKDIEEERTIKKDENKRRKSEVKSINK